MARDEVPLDAVPRDEAPRAEAPRDDADRPAADLPALDFFAAGALRDDDAPDFRPAAFDGERRFVFPRPLFAVDFFALLPLRLPEDFARPLLAAFRTGFFFLATSSPPLPAIAGARIIQFRRWRIETAEES
jgi:hypothetical protein